MSHIDGTRRTGVWLAGATALISGFAVFFNGYGVRAWANVADPTAYTTLKNLVAALTISAAAAVVHFRLRERPHVPTSGNARLALAFIAVIGGSVPFVLFFEGLALANSAQAAAIHKTLIIWVGLFAVLFLRERMGWPHLAAIGALVWGQVVLLGGSADFGFGRGEAMILSATLLWSVEVVVAKKVLSHTSSSTVALARMGGGSLVLVAWVLIRGGGIDWSGLTASHLVWLLVAGAFLSGYVLTWFAALSRAPAVDVTAVLVGGALITAILQSAVEGTAFPHPLGLALIVIGVAVVFWVGRQRRGVTQS
jgi:drug/metabolite transporter (DMT)-like permease